MARRPMNLLSYHVPVAGFTHAVQAPAEGTFLFVSGLTARTSDGGIEAEGDPEGQARKILQSLTAIMAEAGGTLDDVMRIVTYVVDMRHHQAIHAIRRDFFGDEPPASTTVQVSRLYDERQLLEIEATAIISSTAP